MLPRRLLVRVQLPQQNYATYDHLLESVKQAFSLITASSYSLTVRTLGFHPGSWGSIPHTSTTLMGYGVIGNTAVFGIAIQGSSPCTPANCTMLRFTIK